MLESKIRVKTDNENSPIAMLVQTANKFNSSIKLKMEDKIINAKSIMGVIALGNIYDKELTIIADGTDEKSAVTALSDFLTQ